MIHASKTEDMMISKSLKDPETLEQIMKSLGEEIVPDTQEDWHADSAYRIHLVQACVYKSILKALGDQVPKSLKSATERELFRDVSSGAQSFEIN